MPGVVVEEAPQNLAAGDAKWEAIINKEEDMADAAAYQVHLETHQLKIQSGFTLQSPIVF